MIWEMNDQRQGRSPGLRLNIFYNNGVPHQSLHFLYYYSPIKVGLYLMASWNFNYPSNIPPPNTIMKGQASQYLTMKIVNQSYGHIVKTVEASRGFFLTGVKLLHGFTVLFFHQGNLRKLLK